MKNVIVTAAFAVLCLLYSCKDNTSTNDNKSAMDTTASTNNMAAKEATQAEKNEANMRSIYKGIESGDMSVMDGIVADDILDHDGPRGVVRGRDSVKKFLSDFHNHISDMKFEIIAQATGGDFHFALTRLTGKTKDNAMGMPANMNLSDTSIDVVRVKDGKAVEHWGFERPHRGAPMKDKQHKGKM